MGGEGAGPLTLAVPTWGGDRGDREQPQALSSGTHQLLTPLSHLFPLLPSFVRHGDWPRVRERLGHCLAKLSSYIFSGLLLPQVVLELTFAVSPCWSEEG